MKLLLQRMAYQTDGVFSKLFLFVGDEQVNTQPALCVTLEHSYDGRPKLAPGTYLCVRGQHRLHGMTEDFTTFEITGVIGHSGILFHWGNFNKDSDGCVLLGHTIADSPQGTMVTDSRATFAKFMKTLAGANEVQLEVLG